MSLVVSLLEVILRLATLLVFPAVALWVWRAGGAVPLWRATGLGLGLILLLAVFLATPWSGNALVATYGYGYTVPRSLLLHGLTFGFPLIVTALLVQGLAPRLSSRVRLYLLGVLGAAVAWVVGVLVTIRILVALA